MRIKNFFSRGIHGAVIACAMTMTASPALAGLAADHIDVVGAFARAIPPVVPNSGAFLTMKNGANVAHRLVSASSPAAKTVELHTHINDDGVMRMRQVEGIDIAPMGITELKPGGLHIMLIGLNEPLTPGMEIEITLNFKDGSSQTVKAPVRKVGMGGMQNHKH